MALRYKCGAEFLPSPLASKAEFALTAEPPLVRKAQLTAVAVAVEMGHAVAFMGTASGEVPTLLLSPLIDCRVNRPLHIVWVIKTDQCYVVVLVEGDHGDHFTCIVEEAKAINSAINRVQKSHERALCPEKPTVEL